MGPSIKRTSIAAKILLSASLSLIIGLLIVGGSALYLENQALQTLQRNTSVNLVNIMADNIKTAMISGDMKIVEANIKEIVEKNRAVSFSIYNAKGEERGSGAKGDALVIEVLQNNKIANSEEIINGIHILETVLPLPNEERCHACHAKEPKMRGAIKLKTSIEEGYVASRNATLWICVFGGLALVASFIFLAIILRVTVTRKLNNFVDKVTDLARGEGDLTKKINETSRDEFGQLADEINSLVEKIRLIISHIYQTSEQVSSSAVELQSDAALMNLSFINDVKGIILSAG